MFRDIYWTRVFAALAFPILIIAIVYQAITVDINFGIFFLTILALIVDGVYLWDIVEVESPEDD